MTAKTKIRVLVVDDHFVVRIGLKALIEEEADMLLCGEAADGQAALDAVETSKPDVILMDLRMPGMGGVDAIGRILEGHPQVKILVLTTYDSEEDIYRAIEAGAHGYLLKGEFQAAMLEAIRAVHAGQRFIPAAVAARLAERVSGVELSPRELEVLRLLVEGLTNKQIAAQLFVSEDTIKTHLKRTYDKLRVSSRAEAVAVALKRGLLNK